MAGLGESCTHIAALLFAIDGTVKIRDSRTVTQEPAYWLLPASLKGASYSETRSIDFSAAKTLKRRFDGQCNPSNSGTPPPNSARKNKPQIPTPSNDDLQDFFKNLALTGRNPAILSIVKEHSEQFIPKLASAKFPKILTELKDISAVTMNFKDLLDRCSTVKLDISEEEIMNVQITTQKQSDTKEWYEFRAGRVTSSKMKQACQTDPENPSQSLIKSICYPASTKFSNAATRWGIVNETVAKNRLMDVLREGDIHDSLQLEECGLFISLDHPHMAASPDGIISCNCCGRACVEVKCPFSLKGKPVNEECDFLVVSDDGNLRLDEKHQYYYQVQTQMGVARTEFCYFVVWTDVDLHIELILLDPSFYETLCEKSFHLFQSAILPELVGKFYTRLPGSGVPLSNRIRDPNPVMGQSKSLTTDDTNNQSDQSDITEQRWCYCDQVESGQMIACDNENCSIIWFHFSCLKMLNKPKSKTWYCPECRKLPEFSRNRKHPK